MPGVHLELPCAAYTGEESYAFISYAHLDASLVYPEIQRLDLMGFRVWYDEGIDPGNEWPEAVARALKGAAQFIVFVTRNAIQSRNVRNEINYALKLGTPFLAIHLDETELPPGMDLQMSSIQAIMKWRMNEQTYVRNLGRSLPDISGNKSSDLLDLFARAMHSENPAYLVHGERRNWHQLDRSVKEQVYTQSNLLLTILHMTGFNISPAHDGDSPKAFSEDILDLLARLEHDRWSRERIETGWRKATEKNTERKLTPYLIPWSEIVDQVREYDRHAIRQLPRLLLSAGYTLSSIYEDPDRETLFRLANQPFEGTR